MLPFKEAMKQKEKLELNVSEASASLKVFPKLPNGLTPDSVKKSFEYQIAKKNYQLHFTMLKEFNSWFLKNYKKEYRNYRKERK